jgi:hypothetical protein
MNLGAYEAEDAKLSAEARAQDATDASAMTEVISAQHFLLGDTATPSNSSNATKPAPTKKKGATSLRDAKVKAYITKIKKFQQLKKQKWDPEDEEKLANKLVSLDQLAKPTKEERAIEKKVRAGKYSEELSLSKMDEAKRRKRKERKAQEKKQKQIAKDKAERNAAYEKEQKGIKKQLAKYRKLSVPPSLTAAIKEARRSFNSAQTKETSLKGTSAMKEFSKKYKLNRPADKEPDYPKAAAKGKGGKAAAKPAAAKPASKEAQTLGQAAPTEMTKTIQGKLSPPTDDNVETLHGHLSPPPSDEDKVKKGREVEVDDAVSSVLNQANEWP